jgi:hypothetical protein
MDIELPTPPTPRNGESATYTYKKQQDTSVTPQNATAGGSPARPVDTTGNLVDESAAGCIKVPYVDGYMGGPMTCQCCGSSEPPVRPYSNGRDATRVPLHEKCARAWSSRSENKPAGVSPSWFIPKADGELLHLDDIAEEIRKAENDEAMVVLMGSKELAERFQGQKWPDCNARILATYVWPGTSGYGHRLAGAVVTIFNREDFEDVLGEILPHAKAVYVARGAAPNSVKEFAAAYTAAVDWQKAAHEAAQRRLEAEGGQR